MATKTLNASQVLENINNCITELQTCSIGSRMVYHRGKKVFRILAICDELNIFDWWNGTLSMTQLKQMKSFVETAIKLGFKGYVCFKVGAAGCSHGMWAHTVESIDGYSPTIGDILFHSFRSGDNYYDAMLNGQWLHDKYSDDDHNAEFTLKQVKYEMGLL